MNEKKALKWIMIIIQFVISTIALVLILVWFGWKLLLVLFLWTWGNNMMLRNNK